MQNKNKKYHKERYANQIPKPVICLLKTCLRICIDDLEEKPVSGWIAKVKRMNSDINTYRQAASNDLLSFCSLYSPTVEHIVELRKAQKGVNIWICFFGDAGAKSSVHCHWANVRRE